MRNFFVVQLPQSYRYLVNCPESPSKIKVLMSIELFSDIVLSEFKYQVLNHSNRTFRIDINFAVVQREDNPAEPFIPTINQYLTFEIICFG